MVVFFSIVYRLRGLTSSNFSFLESFGIKWNGIFEGHKDFNVAKVGPIIGNDTYWVRGKWGMDELKTELAVKLFFKPNNELKLLEG